MAELRSRMDAIPSQHARPTKGGGGGGFIIAVLRTPPPNMTAQQLRYVDNPPQIVQGSVEFVGDPFPVYALPGYANSNYTWDGLVWADPVPPTGAFTQAYTVLITVPDHFVVIPLKPAPAGTFVPIDGRIISEGALP